MSEIPDSQKRTSRRGFMRGAAAATALVPAAVLTANELDHEKELAKQKMFETFLAHWYPIYERHDQHERILTPENIPPFLNALSIEGTSTNFSANADGKTKKQNELQSPAPSLFAGLMEGMDTSPSSSYLRFPIATLDYLKKHQIPVAFGDVRYNEIDLKSMLDIKEALATRERIGKILMEAGLVAALAGQGLKKAGMDRRAFLRIGGSAALLIGAGAYLPAHYKQGLHEALMEAIDHKDPNLRLWARLNTAASDMMPEYLNDLFRDLVQANKLMALAKHLVDANPQANKPNIGYNWHHGHRGIEDWIRLGPDITRACILAYPDGVLGNIITHNNNDPRSLYAVRLVHVPQSLVIQSVANGGVTYTHDENEKIIDSFIEDSRLAEDLRNRGIISKNLDSVK